MSSRNDITGGGPWPEPEPGSEPDRDRDEGLVVGPPPVADDTRWDEAAEPRGSKGVALAVAGLNVVFAMALPVLLVVGIYTFITVYAIVKAVDSGADTADPATVLIGVVGLVTFFVTLLGLGAWAIGRMADPRKRRG